MKKLIIICILYSSSLLGMDSPFEVPHLLQQLTTKDVTILENIVHEASATTKSQNEELSNTLACIEKIRTIKEAIYTHDREESILNMLDYAYTFVENPQSISFVRTIFEDLKKSEFPENVSDAWHLRKNIILDTASKIQKR